jgi:hypothetical protein
MKQFYFVLWSFCLPSLLFGQDIGQLGLKKGIKASGSVSLNAVSYLANGISGRRDPFNWFASGSLNLNLFGYNAPFSFSYSNLQSSFSQPFNQVSFNPQYKWARAYLGYTSMTFSPYTLAGHVFSGAGLELSPGSWRISLMYGRLRKAVPFNLQDSLQNDRASYRRMGYGLKIGYEHEGDLVELSYFRAKDDTTSLPFVLSNSNLTPKQNVAIAFHGRKKLPAGFFIEGDYSLSVLNNDIRSKGEALPDSLRTGSNLIRGLLPYNTTQRYFDAFSGGIGYQGRGFGIQVRYERIAPEYQTLGAYFFNNDLQNVTIVPSLNLLEGRLNIVANFGLQRNNLDNTRTSTTRRFVSSGTLTFLPNPKWNLSGSYSDFSSFTNVRPRTDPFFNNNIDTLNFYQVTNQYSSNVGYNFGSKEVRHGLMLTASYQRASDRASYQGGGNLSDFYSGNLAYTHSIAPKGLTLTTSVNYYTNRMGEIRTDFWGPNASLGKSFLKKTLMASFGASYNNSSVNGQQGSDVLTNRLGLTYNPSKKEGSKGGHNLVLNINRLQRFKGSGSQPAYSEWTSTFRYTYSF